MSEEDLVLSSDVRLFKDGPPALTFCLGTNEEVLFFSPEETRVYGKRIEDGPEKAREVYEGVLRFLRGEAPPPPASKKFYVV